MGIKPSAALNGTQNNGSLRVYSPPKNRMPTPDPKNLDVVRGISDTARLEYRNMWYLVPPIGYREGIEMQTVQFEMAGLALSLEQLNELPPTTNPVEAGQRLVASDQLTEKLLEKMDEAAALMKRNCTPMSRVQRWFLWWRKKHNPFKAASQAELGDLLNFFSACRTRSSVQRFDLIRARKRK